MATRISALRDAAAKGWADLDAGYFDDVPDTDLNNVISRLGDPVGRARPST